MVGRSQMIPGMVTLESSGGQTAVAMAPEHRVSASLPDAPMLCDADEGQLLQSLNRKLARYIKGSPASAALA